MDLPQVGARRVETLRRWIFWVLVVGLAGTEIELVLLQHYEDPSQLVPLLLIACAMGVLAWHARRPDAASRGALKILMALFVAAGFAGVALHFRGAAAFQLETDPTLGTLDLVKKVMHVTAPPLLAPGVMLQLGLMGLAYALSDSRPTGHDNKGAT